MTSETPKEPQTEDKGNQDAYQVGKVCPRCSAIIAADERHGPGICDVLYDPGEGEMVAGCGTIVPVLLCLALVTGAALAHFSLHWI